MPVNGDKVTNDQSGSGVSSCPPTPAATIDERSESLAVTPTQKPCNANAVKSVSSKSIVETVMMRKNVRVSRIVACVHDVYLGCVSTTGRWETC